MYFATRHATYNFHVNVTKLLNSLLNTPQTDYMLEIGKIVTRRQP